MEFRRFYGKELQVRNLFLEVVRNGDGAMYELRQIKGPVKIDRDAGNNTIGLSQHTADGRILQRFKPDEFMVIELGHDQELKQASKPVLKQINDEQLREIARFLEIARGDGAANQVALVIATKLATEAGIELPQNPAAKTIDDEILYSYIQKQIDAVDADHDPLSQIASGMHMAYKDVQRFLAEKPGNGYLAR